MKSTKNTAIVYESEAGKINFRSPKHLKLKQAKTLSKLNGTDAEDIEIEQLIEILQSICMTNKDADLIEELTVEEAEEAITMWGDSLGKEEKKKSVTSS